MLRKLLIIIFGILIPLAMVIMVFMGYEFIYGGNVDLGGADEKEVYVFADETPVDIYNRLVEGGILESPASFKMIAQQKKWFTAKPGRYIITNGMSNNDLVNMFRAGLQAPTMLTVNTLQSVSDFAGKAAKQLMIDSVSIFTAFTNASFLAEQNLNYATVRAIILPNSYEMYWNTSAEKLRERMVKEYHKFWTEARQAQAKRYGLSAAEVSVLASIVEKETAKVDEMPRVSGLYINRLKKGMRLQSDPTVIYAKKLKEGMDIEVHRVLYADLEIDSPYNTYKYAGLPPAPITIPSIQAIKAVLNPEAHAFIFMCADPERPGYHSFAANNRQHNINKQKYVKWLNEQGIRR